MFVSVELIDLLLYCVQQLGIMVGVGAETIFLILYILAMRDGTVSEVEAQFSRAVRKAIKIGLTAIVLSGVTITLVHTALGQQAILSEPAFLFKWGLIFGLVLVYLIKSKNAFSNVFVEGVIGATWYALFLIHIIAPVTTWVTLLIAYFALEAIFVGSWFAGVRAFNEHSKEVAAQKAPPQTVPLFSMSAPVAPPPPPPPKPVPPPVAVAVKEIHEAPVQPALLAVPLPPKAPAPLPPAPKPAVVMPPPPPPPLPPIKPAVLSATPHPTQAHAPELHSEWLPAIHVMPQTQAELDSKSHITPVGSFAKAA